MIDSKSKDKNGFFQKMISKDQSKDTGMALVLLFLLIGYFSHNNKLFIWSIPLLVINMVVPIAYWPIAKIWIGVSNLLGTIMSKVMLTIIFFALVTPVGIIRKILRVDSLQLKKWKKDNSSVFRNRDYEFKPYDIEKPY